MFQLLQFILFTSFHNAVIHDWMVSRVPTCKGAQNNEQELFQGFLTELAGLTRTVLFQGSKQVRAEHTRRENSIASWNLHSCKGFCTPGQMGPDVITPQRARQDTSVSFLKDVP